MPTFEDWLRFKFSDPVHMMTLGGYVMLGLLFMMMAPMYFMAVPFLGLFEFELWCRESRKVKNKSEK